MTRLIATETGFLVLPTSHTALTRSCARELMAFLRAHGMPFHFGVRDDRFIMKIGPLTALQSAEFTRWSKETASLQVEQVEQVG